MPGDHGPFEAFFSAAIESHLRQLLESYKIQELRAIARRRGFDVKAVAKTDIAEQLVEALRESISQPDFLQGLTQEELEGLRLLNTVYGIRDYVTRQEVEYVWSQHGRRSVSARLNVVWHGMKGGRRGLRKVLDGLFEYGLLFPCRLHSETAEHYHWLPYLGALRLPVLKPTIATYPRRKRRRLFRPDPTPPASTAMWLLVAFAERETLRRRPPPDRHRQAHLYPWLGQWEYDLDEVNRLIRQGHGHRYTYSDASITIPTSGYLIADDVLDRLASWLGSDRSFAYWLIRLAIAAGLLIAPADWETPPALIQERWLEWVGLLPEEQSRALFEVWRRVAGGFIELALALQSHPDLRLERSIRYTDFAPEDLARDVAEARGFVTRLLQEVPAGTWLNWNQFADWARRVDPEFLHSYWPPETWGFAAQRPERLDPTRQRHWEVAYRPVLAAFFEGPLRWLGVVDVAYRGRNLVTFRLTETGAWLLRGEGQPRVAASGKPGEPPITWQDERTFRVQPIPEMLNLLRLVGSFTTPTDRPYTYRLAEANIEGAFARGLGPSVFVGAFQKLGAPLPDATRRELEDLWSRFGRVHLYEKLTVLELADDLALREVLANTKLKDHIIHEFSSRLVVIEDSAVDDLVEELVKKGYTPAVLSR